MGDVVPHEVAGDVGHFGSKPNRRPYLRGPTAMVRWKEGPEPLPPTAVGDSSRDAKDVAMLFHRMFQLQCVLLCPRRSLEMMAIFAPSQI